jgi:hypothetical protein
MRLSWSNPQFRLYVLGLLLGLFLFGAISYKAFSLGDADHIWDAVKNTTDYQSILFVNALIGISATRCACC